LLRQILSTSRSRSQKRKLSRKFGRSRFASCIGDLNRHGNPCRVNADGDVLIDERKMTALMAVLSGVNLPNIMAMDPRDWNSCAYRLRNFFLPNPDAWL
jgi:hypothetical protein